MQFSSLPCSDIKQPALPLGLSGDRKHADRKNGIAEGMGVKGTAFISTKTLGL